MSFFTLTLSLFLLMDPVGNVPIFLSLLQRVNERRKKRVILRELLIALLTMVLFFFLGDLLLEELRITESAVMISGATILFLIALKLIFPVSNGKDKSNGNGEFDEREPFIVPLAIPMVAGPAVLASLMLYSRQDFHPFFVLGAILVAWAFSTIILLSSTILNRLLGKRGIAACERLMGLLLVLLAVQMFLNGIQSFLSH